MPRCTASTKSGTRCKLQAVENCKLCSVHAKEAKHTAEVESVVAEPVAAETVAAPDAEPAAPPSGKPKLKPHEIVDATMEESDGGIDGDANDAKRSKSDDAYITQLINRIVSLELEISNQKQTISQMTRTTTTPSVISDGEIQSNPKKSRKPRRYIWTNERIEQKARWLYYHEHKKDTAILQAIYTRLAAAGVMYNVSVKVNGAVQEQPFLPWQYIKKTCDNMFDELPQDEKQTYMHQVISMLN